MTVNFLTQVRNRDLVRVLSKQPDAQVGFQLADFSADGGLGHPQQRSCLREAAALDHLPEYEQRIDIKSQVLTHKPCCSKFATLF